ncbi:hypothetical protein VTO42DRAFT_5271 [Malbranchea cinnamomea]
MVNSPNPSLRVCLRPRSPGATAAVTRTRFGQLNQDNDLHEPETLQFANFPERNNGVSTRTTRLNQPSRSTARVPSSTQPANLVAGQERPPKKAKLEGSAYDGPGSPKPRKKLQLQSRENHKPLHLMRRGPSKRPKNNATTPAMMSPPRALFPPHASGFARSRRGSSPTPVHIGEADAGKRRSGPRWAASGKGLVDVRPALNPGDVSAQGSGSERRSLRSHDGGSRSKSELASYFANYEQLLTFEPEKSEFLSPDTTIFLIDNLSEPPFPQSDLFQEGCATDHAADGQPPRQFPENPLLNPHNARIIELPNDSAQPDEDPLPEDMYFKAHRRHERQEKQLKNIEKERAQHEKLQLERILSELKGPDWLRVMGITGITDSEKKLYEPKRDYFIKEVSVLVDKFRAWKEEEKRRKMIKEQRLAAENREEDGGEQEDDQVECIKEGDDANDLPCSQDGQLPDIDDVDGWAARQLQQEALSASRKRLKAEPTCSKTVTATPRKSGASIAQLPVLIPPHLDPPEGPFTSFYDKPHLRATALGQSNKRATLHTAFGHPLPNMPEREFRLPDDILTQEAIIAASRRNRVRRREQRKKS